MSSSRIAGGGARANATGSGLAYVYNETYDATHGITQAEFENNELYAMAAPCERQLIQNPNLMGSAVLVTNLSGKDIDICVSRPNATANLTAENFRENQSEVVNFGLPSGQASHVNIDPRSIILNISSQVNSSSGGYQTLTGPGWNLFELENKAITVKNGGNDMRYIVTQNTYLDQYCTISNQTGMDIKVTIKQSDTVYGMSEESLREYKLSRLPDLGSEPKATSIIAPNGELHIAPPPQLYTVRALQQNQQTSPATNGFFVPASSINDVRKYVEHTEATTEAGAGQWVVFFIGEDGETITSATYECQMIKPVSPDLVRTES